MMYIKNENYDNEYVGEDGCFDPLKDLNHNNDRIPIKIPVEFRYKCIPEDINYFIKGIYDNIYLAVFKNLYNYKISKKEKMDYTIEIISSALIYLLGVTQKDKKDKNGNLIYSKGTLRYKKYNSIEYSKIPYYRWFINEILYFVKAFKVKKYEEQEIENKTLYINGFEKNSKNTEDDNSVAGNRIMAQMSEGYITTHQYSNGYDVYVAKEKLGVLNKSGVSTVDLKEFEEPQMNSNVISIRLEIEKFHNSIIKNDPNTVYLEILNIFDYLADGIPRLRIMKHLNIDRNILRFNVKKIEQILALNFPNLKNDLIKLIANA